MKLPLKNDIKVKVLAPVPNLLFVMACFFLVSLAIELKVLTDDLAQTASQQMEPGDVMEL